MCIRDSLSWAIEVYFKEARQHLGFLQEQSNHYAAYVASTQLTAIRFFMLVMGKCHGYSDGISAVRDRIIANATATATAMDHVTRLWHMFHAVIAGALDELKTELGDKLARIMESIERHVESGAATDRTLRLEAT